MNHYRIIEKIREKVKLLYHANLISSKSFNNCGEVWNYFDLESHHSVDNVNIKNFSWEKAKGDTMKLNSDGFLKEKKGGCGGIIRNYLGDLIVAYAGPSSSTTIIHAELDSIIYGLKICIDKGFKNIWIESDALQVINMLHDASK